MTDRLRRDLRSLLAGRAGRAAAVILVVALAAASCTTTGDARNPLASAAQHERPRPPAAPPPAPPGVEDVAVAPSADPEKARLPLAEATARIVASRSDVAAPPSPPSVPPPTAEQRREALKAYLRGRAAVTAGELPQAVGELEQAHVLDPSSPEVLRQLGRAYSLAGNGPRAAEAFRRLRALEPDDSEALFTIGMNAANRRQWEEAAAYLAVLRRLLDERRSDANLATVIAVDFALATSLAELGYDAAFLDAARRATSHPLEPLAAAGGQDSARIGELFRRRSELAQQMGDAMLRLGEADAAVAQYRAAAALPTADPRTLRTRIVLALLVAGRPIAAQSEFLDSIAVAGSAGDAEVALAGYLAEQGIDARRMARAIESMSLERPDEPALVRILARLDPPATVRLLSELAARSPGGEGAEQLLDWLEQVDPAGAVAIAVDLVARNDEVLEPAALRLVASAATPGELRDRVRRLPDSPARDALEGAILVAERDPVAAWALLAGAAAKHGPDPALARARVLAAAALADPQLVREVEAWRAPRGVVESMPLVAGYLAAGASEEAWRIVEAAGDASGLPSATRAAWLVLESRAAAAEAAAAVGTERGLLLSIAVRAAEGAVEADPRAVGAWEWLISLRDPRGGAAADAGAHGRAIARMAAALEGEPIVERLRAEEELARGRVDAAIERLEAVVEQHPADVAALQAIVASLSRVGRTNEILPRLDRRRAESPGEPAGWDLWTAAMIRAGRAAEAEQALRALLEADPAHPFAKGLLEALERATGKAEQAESMSLARISARPPTLARDLDLASWSLERCGRLARPARPGAGVDAAAIDAAGGEAIDRAMALARSMPSLTRDQRWRLLTIPLQAPPSLPSRSPAIRDLAEEVLAADPGSPLAVHGAAILGAALEGADEVTLAELAARAVASPAAQANDDEAAVRWLGIAERLLSSGEPEAAALVLRVATLAIPFPDGEARRTLQAATVGLDARCGGRADRTLAYLDELAALGRLGMGGSLMRPSQEGEPSNPILEASSIYSIVGDRAGSLAILERVVERDPGDAMALNNLGYGRLEDGRLDERTIGLLGEAHELRPSDPHILDSLGWLRYRRGWIEDRPEGAGAVSLIEEAVRLNGESASLEGLDHLGDAMWRIGRREEAIRAWQRAVEAGLRRFEREGTIRGIEAFQRGEFGLVLRDPADFYEQNYGEILDRVRAKLRAITDRREPEVAPIEPPLEPAAGGGA